MNHNFFMLLWIIVFPFIAQSQQPIELSLGNGYKAQFTPPPGWVKGTVYNDEYCYYKPGNEASICIRTKWKRDRSAAEILKESISGLPVIKCKDLENKTEVTHTVWKECEVKVGPRVEGRIWMVVFYKETMNALQITVEFQKADKAFFDLIKKTIDGIKFAEPQKQ